MRPQTFIFIGRSGSGKGTQAELLMDFINKKDDEKRNIFYLESGARFRDFIAGKSFSSKLSRVVYQKHERQPDFLAVWNWAHLFVDSITGDEHLIIDGTPRSLPEAKVLDTAMEFYKRSPIHVVYVDVSRKWSEEKLLARGRLDDTAEGVSRRTSWFESDVLPTIDYYRSQPEYFLVEVNGEQSIEKVHEEIISKLQIE